MKEPSELEAASPIVVAPRHEGVSLLCVYCHDRLSWAEAVYCGACLAPHHEDCFLERRVCSVLGCSSRVTVRARERRRSRVVPAVIGLLVASNLGTACCTRRREPLRPVEVEHRVPLRTNREKDLEDLRVDFAETCKRLKENETLIAMSRNPGTSFYFLSGPPIPAIDARVAAVKNDVQPSLVLLSVGSDDKVEKGFHFSIHRGTEFVGRVVVEKVLKDSSGCRVLFTKEGASIQQGDMAATRLP